MEIHGDPAAVPTAAANCACTAAVAWPPTTDEGLPGPECFGTTLVHRERHTWHQLLALPSSLAGSCTSRTSKAAQHEGSFSNVDVSSPANSAVAIAAAKPILGPVWTEVDPRACRRRGIALSQIKGLPKYELCFQGF